MTFPTDAELDEIEKRAKEFFTQASWLWTNVMQHVFAAARDRNRLERENADLRQMNANANGHIGELLDQLAVAMSEPNLAWLSDLRERCAKIAAAIRALPLTPEPDESNAG